MLAGGAEEVLNDLVIQGALKIRAMSNQHYPQARASSRPFN
jgi:3-oxoacyl-(acyl-carrier-protein) synthase